MFTVLSRTNALKYQPKGTALMVSITDPGSERPVFQHKYEASLFLQFHDMDKFYSGYTTIEPEDARKILDMVEAHPNVDEIVVHCEAGQSRSAGTAAALSKILTGDDMRFFRPPFTPNRLVYSTILYEKFGAAFVGQSLHP